MKVLYFDCGCGISGDMFVGALLDVGADFGGVEAGLASLGLKGYVIRAEEVRRKGIRGMHFRVLQEEGVKQPHRHLAHIREIIERGKLPEDVKAASLGTFQRIAEAEAAVHGTSVEKVHFHEVGAVDSIVDVVGAYLALHSLGVDRVESSPLNVGGGTVQCAHGVLPVPAPATAELLRGVPSYGGEVQVELVTPTGAALITSVAAGFGAMPMLRVERVGYGAGTRELADRPNLLRVLMGEGEPASGGGCSVRVIETNVDDMSAELLAPLVGNLIAAGARDAFLTQVMGKKGRPGYLVTVLCDEEKVSELVGVLMDNSTTFGVRMRREERVCLAREWRKVETPWGDVRIKLGGQEGEVTRRAPEFEDCRAVAEAAGVAVLAVYEAAFAAAIRGEFKDA